MTQSKDKLDKKDIKKFYQRVETIEQLMNSIKLEQAK
jgi:hypothetical protein